MTTYQIIRKQPICFHLTLVFALATTNIARASEPFTIVALPDTQNYVNNPQTAQHFTQQTQWIADQIQQTGNPRNIQFVSHLGDVVSTASNQIEWQRANTSMDILDGVVKYSVLPGNHDYEAVNTKHTGTANYLANFGPQRFADHTWYEGADPSGNNSYQRFEAGGFEFLHLAMEWIPTSNSPLRNPSPIEWAQSILDMNPDTPVILSTHAYISDNPPGRDADGEDLWNELIRGNDQIFMVLNGHYHSFGFLGGEVHQVSMNDANRPVFEILQNYQDHQNGWLRLINFDIPNDLLKFETYSPVLDQFQTETVSEVGQRASQFELSIDFSTRLSPINSTTGDFDLDGDLDGTDFLLWQGGGSPSPLSASDLSDWQAGYGANTLFASTAATVPEPGLSYAYLPWLLAIANRRLFSR